MTSDTTIQGMEMMLVMVLVPMIGLIIEGLKVGLGKKQ
jgi:hypothetical protein